MIGKRTNGREVTPVERSTEAKAEMSVISKDMSILGDCATNGRLRIEGKVSGRVRARSLELVPSGTIEGDVEAPEGGAGDESFIISGRVAGAVRASHVEVRRGGTVLGGIVADQATIHGRIEGGILARKRLALEESAVVEGDVHARLLSLKEGGQVNGNIHMGTRAQIGGAAKDGAKEDGAKAEDGVVSAKVREGVLAPPA